MKLPRFLFLAFAVLFPMAASAQISAPVGVSHDQVFARPGTVPIQSDATMVATTSGMPRWLRWGLVGAVGGAVIYTAIKAGDTHPGSVVGNAFAGALAGFIIVGGGVAVYDAVCDARRGGC